MHGPVVDYCTSRTRRREDLLSDIVVFCEDAEAERARNRVDPSYDRLDRINFEDGKNRSEDLFLQNWGVPCDIDKNGRRDVKIVCVRLAPIIGLPDSSSFCRRSNALRLMTLP